MRYLALATDYDGTIAHDGRVDDDTIEALKRIRKSGRRVVLVTGRMLDDLASVAPDLALFDLVVAENGALLYDPATHEETVLAPPPPREFVDALRARTIAPLDVGRAIVATWHPHETLVIETIARLGLDLQVTFNKGAVMVLPPGVNKASGLLRALEQLELSPHNVVAVGDAENDLAMLGACEAAIAVANALESVKDRCDAVTQGIRGAGVVELAGRLLEDDLASLEPALGRHAVVYGRYGDRERTLAPYGGTLLVTGSSGGGKSTLTAAVLERLIDRTYQCCIIDPEGDYEGFYGTVSLGGADRVPADDEVVAVLATRERSVAVNLLAVPIDERPRHAAALLASLFTLRARTGRPHWIVIDEAHHLFPHDWDASSLLPADLFNVLLVTVDPRSLAKRVIDATGTVLAVGDDPMGSVEAVCACIGSDVPARLEEGCDGICWDRDDPARMLPFAVVPGRAERRRHLRKYAMGELAPEKSFYFVGPHGRLNLRAKNFQTFADLARGVDDETWLYHLRGGDYSRWLRERIGDQELADELASIEAQASPDARATRDATIDAIERRYTAPATAAAGSG